MRRKRVVLKGMLLAGSLLSVVAARAEAQPAAGQPLGTPMADVLLASRPRPDPAVEVTGGYAGFADEGVVGHGLLGAALRYHLTPRISVGPEVVYMVGPGDDRDLMLTGNLTFDLLSPRPGQAGGVTPFLVVGGGLFHSSNTYNGVGYGSSEGAFTAGAGVRAWVTPRVYVASEFRVGWELHLRVSGTVGFALPSAH